MTTMPGDGLPVVWTSALFDRSGYAEEARNTILALDQAGVPVHADPLAWRSWLKPLARRDAERLEQLIALELPDRFVHVMHGFAHRFARHPRAIRCIGRTMWETDGLLPEWVARCNEMDEVWVPSDLNLETFARAGVPAEKLHKVPEGIHHLYLYDPTVQPLEIPGLSGFVFLSVFAWSRRKGWDVLVRAYLEEFRRDEAVTLLLLVTSFRKPVAEHVAELRAFVASDLGRDLTRSAKIVVLDVEPGAKGMPRLYRSAQAYVQPSRGEGWGRTLMEAMAMGLPTIGTRWSGNLEFMNEHNSYLVDYELVEVSEVAAREWPWFRGQRWAEPSVEHLRALMRRVVDRPEEAKAKGAQARYDIFARCNSGRVAEAVVERLGGVPAGPASRRVSRPAPAMPLPPEPDRASDLGALERRARAEPGDPDRAYRLGLAYWGAGRPEEAVEQLRRAVTLVSPAADGRRERGLLVATHLALARILHERDDDKEAATHARQALELAPGNPAGYAIFAEILERLGLIETAFRAYARALGPVLLGERG